MRSECSVFVEYALLRHDMTTMKNTVFRRDEIWFAAENERHESEIYSLYEIRRENNERVNSTAAYDKQYLEGRYGADPYLTNIAGRRRMAMSLKPPKKVIWVKVGRNHGGIRIS